jgi:single-strand DNA-binding protein
MGYSDINRVTLMGYLGSDPEFKYTPKGTAVARFSLGTKEKYKDASGVAQEKTIWHRIVAWGKLAEICGKHLRKGQRIVIEGKISYNEWEKDGRKQRDTDIVMKEFWFCSGKKEDDHDDIYF